MLDTVVKRDRLIQIPPSFRDVSRQQQGTAHDAMPNHERSGRTLFFGKRQDLSRQLARRVAVERHKVRGQQAIEDRE